MGTSFPPIGNSKCSKRVGGPPASLGARAGSTWALDPAALEAGREDQSWRKSGCWNSISLRAGVRERDVSDDVSKSSQSQLSGRAVTTSPYREPSYAGFIPGMEVASSSKRVLVVVSTSTSDQWADPSSSELWNDGASLSESSNSTSSPNITAWRLFKTS